MATGISGITARDTESGRISASNGSNRPVGNRTGVPEVGKRICGRMLSKADRDRRKDGARDMQSGMGIGSITYDQCVGAGGWDQHRANTNRGEEQRNQGDPGVVKEHRNNGSDGDDRCDGMSKSNCGSNRRAGRELY